MNENSTMLREEPWDDVVKRAFDGTFEDQRYLWFSDRIKYAMSRKETAYEDEEKICWSDCVYSVKWGSKGVYVKGANKKGFTFWKDTKKIRVWFGSNIKEFDLKRFMKHRELEWFNSMPFDITKTMTKTLLEKIITGKITNPKDYIKAWFKLSHRTIEVTPNLFYRYVKDREDKQYRHAHQPMNMILSWLYVAKNVDSALNYWMKEGTADHGSTLVIDLVRDAQQLGREVDFTWSDERIRQEHEEWTAELMIREIDFVGEEKVIYKEKEGLELPEGWEIIDTQRRLYEEGFKQKHCIYNNYWNRVKEGKYFVFHVKLDDLEGVTVGVIKSHTGHIYGTREGDLSSDMEDPHYRVDAAYGYRNNKTVKTQELVKEAGPKIDEIVESLEFQEFFEANYDKVTIIAKDGSIIDMKTSEPVGFDAPLPF